LTTVEETKKAEEVTEETESTSRNDIDDMIQAEYERIKRVLAERDEDTDDA
jgi:ATP-dependent Zn protease